MQLGSSGHYVDIAQYAELFLQNHINGRRLLRLTPTDLQAMGIASVGHVLDLITEMELLKAHNLRLLNFPPLAKETTASLVAMAAEQRQVNLTLIFGHHLRSGPTSEDTKWKMYVEIDDEEDSGDTPLPLVHDVAFTCKNPAFGTFKLNYPPFIMEKWCHGTVSDMTVECVVSYEATVQKPKSTRFLYQLDSKAASSCQKTVTLTLEQHTGTAESPQSGSVVNSIVAPPIASVPSTPSRPLPHSASSPLLQGVWKNKSDFVSVTLPESVKYKSDLWASIVAGRSRSGSMSTAKPIPGTTMTLPVNPALPASRSHSLTGHSPSYPSLSDAVSRHHSAESPLSGGANSPGGNDTGDDNTAKVKFFLEETSSVGSRTSTESGYSENRHGNTGSYADMCKKPVSSLAKAAVVGDSVKMSGNRDVPIGRGSPRSSAGDNMGKGDNVGKGEWRWNRDGQDGQYHRGRGRNYDSRGGNYEGRGGNYSGRGENYRGRKGNYGNRDGYDGSRDGYYGSRGGNYGNRGENYGNREDGFNVGHSRGRRGGRYHHDDQYSRQGGRQARSEPQLSAQNVEENQNLRRAVSDRPPHPRRR
ncbi:hypothetical protein V1264_013299 [Littorina saxatilis]|uniref:SAM domain-containing protein n=2 Tax=Littorina saxatilis TaxID=31220 RepID=A0AAN9GIE3_9CAEN